MKTRNIFIVVLLILAFSAVAVFAQTSAEQLAAANQQALTEAQTQSILLPAYYLKYLAACLGIAIAAFGCALAMGRATSSAYESVSRNPSVGSRIQTLLILGLALIESLAIYAFVIAILAIM